MREKLYFMASLLLSVEFVLSNVHIANFKYATPDIKNIFINIYHNKNKFSIKNRNVFE